MTATGSPYHRVLHQMMLWHQWLIPPHRRIPFSSLAQVLCHAPHCHAVVWILMGAALCQRASAADYAEVEQLFYQGDYAGCQEQAAAEVERGVWNERWSILLARCQLITGQYGAAQSTYEAALERYQRSIELRLVGHDVYRHVDQPAKALQQLDEIVGLASEAPFRYTSRSNLITLGRCFLARGEDARKILELFYDRVRREDPKFVDTYLASAELALEKHDTKVAIDALRTAVKLDPHNPHTSYLLARAWESTDSEQASAALVTALTQNPKYIPALLMRAENQIDAERYDQARATLDEVLSVNPHHPQAWAYRAILAHLQGDYDGERIHRDTSLLPWKTNPAIDYWIGQKLSQKYRFAEGATYQRRALEMDPDFLPAKFQLAQDLLRLGQSDEGWQLTHAVHRSDGYHVVAFNLVNLHDRLQQYATLERDGLILRMTAEEASIYGEDVLHLLQQARDALCSKYGVVLEGTVTIEIFPKQQDFAVRTFGMPGGDGFLGVCFGRVITANSPASQGESPSNWQSVLWHEFCHVVTLEKTKNRMPRWLSEGISVFEERQHHPSWGEQLTPQYREMILGDDLTPVSELSGAFLQPKSPIHLQFAYYESSLVVQYLIEKHGHATLLRLLDDLSVGISIEETLERHIGPAALLDKEFAEYARHTANSMAPDLDWEREGMPERATTETWSEWLNEHPRSYWGLRNAAAQHLAEQQWEEAGKLLVQLRDLYPNDVSPGNALEQLAQVYRQQSDAPHERQTLEQLAALNNDVIPVYRRLMELAAADNNWADVRKYAEQFLAVQPLLPIGHEQVAQAAEANGDHARVINALNALLAMQPVDPAAIHFRLARAHESLNNLPMARRHVLLCLAEAPRFRDAQAVLLRLQAEQPTPVTPAANPDPSPATLSPAAPPAIPSDSSP